MTPDQKNDQAPEETGSEQANADESPEEPITIETPIEENDFNSQPQ